MDVCFFFLPETCIEDPPFEACACSDTIRMTDLSRWCMALHYQRDANIILAISRYP